MTLGKSLYFLEPVLSSIDEGVRVSRVSNIPPSPHILQAISMRL